ncbi:hypothetical protein [Streptomyces beijiangensis]|uniref:Phage or prophage related protein n=1 Tax=Streptomyces beijiangensis TaxID=163361 RepID=A0A939F471_9ACTN|nr:hypothetical protein [Streptomyces beijiangensis]MBO0511960.1 hypothetical protein [Streptomyces beijiangensis]
MARIRTIKPEAFISESLAAVSVYAERTFFGLLTQADDHGRFRDQAAVIAGALWSLRPEHSALDVEDDLTQLHSAGLICRYEGGDSKRYLHIATWARHQKINRPSGSRFPDCPHHQGNHRVTSTAPVHAVLQEPAVSSHGGSGEGARERHEPSVKRESAGQHRFSEPSPQSPEGSVTAHGPDLGPRILDLGSPPVGSASAPAPPTVSGSGSVSAKDLVGEYVASCAHRPPSDVLGRLGKVAGNLLGEGISADHIRAGMDRMRAKSLSVGLLPSLVNEAMNAPHTVSAPHRAWTNPASGDVEAAYGGQL